VVRVGLLPRVGRAPTEDRLRHPNDVAPQGCPLVLLSPHVWPLIRGDLVVLLALEEFSGSTCMRFHGTSTFPQESRSITSTRCRAADSSGRRVCGSTASPSRSCDDGPVPLDVELAEIRDFLAAHEPFSSLPADV